LAAGRTRQELAQGQQLTEVLFIHPTASFHELAVEITYVSDRAAKGGQSKAKENAGDFEHTTGLRVLLGGVRHRGAHVQSNSAMKPKSICNCMWQ
jgi:hypothetical protein